MSLPKNKHIYSLTAFVLLLISPAAFGQTAARDFAYISGSSAWLSSKNAAGLCELPLQKVSYAELSAVKSDGKFIGTSDSPNSIKAGVATESYVRVSPKLCFHGKMDYSYFFGKDMGGSVFMDPNYNFMNIEEYANAANGNKVKELFSLDGSLSYALGSGWSLGARGYYQAGNYAKQKDPRSDSEWMDMDLSAGVRWALGRKLKLGLDFEYRRSVEGVKSQRFGITGIDYSYLADYGAFFGTAIMLSETTSGFICTSRNPMTNNFIGGGLQAEFGLGDMVFFNDISFLSRSGSYGQDGENEVMYETAEGFKLSYHGNLNFGGNHIVDISADYNPVEAYKNIYEITTTTGESSKVIYHGKQHSLSRSELCAKLSYTGHFGVKDFLPGTTIGAAAGLWLNDLTAEIFPFYRKQNVMAVSAEAFVRHNFVFGANVLTPRVDVLWGQGGGVKNEDGKTNPGATGEASSKDEYLNQEFEYRTIGRVTGGVSLRYTRCLSDKFSVYIQAGDRICTALSTPEFIGGRTFNQVFLTIGLGF